MPKIAQETVDAFYAAREARTKQIKADGRPKTQDVNSKELLLSARRVSPSLCKSVDFMTAGNARIRRMEPPIIPKYAEKLGVFQGITPDNRAASAKLCQISLVHVDRASLLLPGEEGYACFLDLPDKELERLTVEVLTFNEMECDAPVATAEVETTNGENDPG